MSAILRRAQRATLLLVVALLGLSMLSPLMSLAQASFTAGETAVIASGGGSVNVRADADPAADSLGQIPDGTEVYILDGPYTASDGSVWYHAGVWDLTGYINASMLGSVPSASSAETEAASQAAETASSSIPWKQPIDYGVVVDNSNSPLPADGLACRTDASSSASTIVRLWINQSVEVVGQSVWVDGVQFLPINCQGVGGFVKADYIALQSKQVAASENSATEEVVVTEEATAVDADAPVAGDLIVTVLDQNGATVPGACFALYLGGELIADSCDANDSIPNNGNSGFFGIPAGSYSLVSTSLDANNQEVWIGAGNTAYATVNVTSDAPVATDEVATEEPATDEVVTETPIVTEEVATDEAATEDAATDEAVETEIPATEEVTTDVVETEIAEATEVATETPVTAVATEVLATEEPTDTATETVVPTDETATEVATEAPGSMLGEPIGDATVTGTNGEGIRCRVAPDASAATITTLAEGTTVFVYAEPTNGYLAIGCGNQLGYGDVNYLWSGGAGDEIPASASSVIVVGTGGMALNCRSGAGTSYPVVATVAQGTVLTSRGASSNGWAPVVCGGKNGFVSIAYVEASGQTPGNGSGQAPATGGQAGKGTVTGTGSSLRCRSSASTSGAIITSLPDGTVVTTRGAASNGWVPVVCAGQNGFVSAEYLTLGSGSVTGTTTPTATATTTPGSDSGTTGAYVKVTGTGGSSLNCRSAASMSGMVITAIPFGSTVATRGAASNGWVPITCAGKAGYVSADYVTATTNPGGGTTNPGTNPGTGDGGGTTGTAVVNAGGSGLRCRSGANASAPIITTVADGSTVTTRGASSNGWTPVVCGGQNGFMSSEFLSSGGGSGTTPTPPPTSTPGNGSGMVNGDHGKVTVRANMRYQASTSANVMIVVEPGEVLLITGGVTNGFYPVDYDGLRAFMSADLLVKTSEPLSKRGGSGNDPDPGPAPGGGSATGSALVNYAMRYIGYPYVAATHGPSTFDCSGFTYWVAKNVMGIDIGTGTWTQTVAGTAVSRSALQPGDLVFFQNTYKAGLSHVGIYIGNNQFVHAENENTGVRVSDLNSTYYSSRWYGATRLG